MTLLFRQRWPAMDPIRCVDCRWAVVPGSRWGKPPPNRPTEWYMVHDHVWAEAGMVEADDGRWERCLCIGCLQARLGRALRGTDLAPLPVNEPGRYWDTNRLDALKRIAAHHYNLPRWT